MTAGCPHRDDAGAWVLRSLHDAQARAYEAHLATCESCRAEVARLQVAADLLPMAAPQVLPPPELRDRIMREVRSEAELLRASGAAADRPAAGPRRRRRWLGPVVRLRPLPAAALASVLLALGVAGGIALSGGGDGGGGHQVVARSPAGSRVVVDVRDGRAQLRLSGMPEAPAGRVYQVWLRHGDRAPRPTRALFTVPRDGRTTVAVAERLGDADQVLVTAEPPGGSRAPTSAPVIAATLT